MGRSVQPASYVVCSQALTYATPSHATGNGSFVRNREETQISNIDHHACVPQREARFRVVTQSDPCAVRCAPFQVNTEYVFSVANYGEDWWSDETVTDYHVFQVSTTRGPLETPSHTVRV